MDTKDDKKKVLKFWEHQMTFNTNSFRRMTWYNTEVNPYVTLFFMSNCLLIFLFTLIFGLVFSDTLNNF